MARKVEFISGLKKVYDRARTDPYDLFTEALAVGFQDDYKQSLNIIEKAIYLSTKFDDPEKKSLFLVFKAMALDRLNRDSEALECVEKAIKLDKKSPLSWDIKGDLLHDFGKYEEALAAYENSIKNSDEDELSESLLDKAEILSHLKRDKDALKIINQALELDPENPIGWDMKSDTLSDLGRYDEALQAAEKGLSFDEEHVDLLIDMGSVLIKLGKNEEALSYFNKGIQFDSSDELLWYNKACVLSILDRKDEALDALTVAIALDPDNILKLKKEKDFGNIKNTERFIHLANQDV